MSPSPVKTLVDVLTLSRPLIGCDLETTSPNPNTARIVEIGLEIMGPGQPTREYRTLVNPECPIPPASTEKHGITDEMVIDAPKITDLADNLIRGLSGVDFSGYNVRFDLKVFQNEFARVERRWNYENSRVLDGYRLWQEIEKRTLEDAIRRWCPEYLQEPEPIDGRTAHSALWDTKGATRVIAGMVEQRGLPRDVQALHDLCFADQFDMEGKLKYNEHRELVINFGQHRGKLLVEMDRGWLGWIIRNDFSDKVKQACRNLLDQ